jgi:hypothetical protein
MAVIDGLSASFYVAPLAASGNEYKIGRHAHHGANGLRIILLEVFEWIGKRSSWDC